MSSLKIGKLTSQPIIINAPKEFAHLVPVRAKESITLRLDGCRNTIPNALRRVIMSELTIVGLNANTDAFDTNDQHLFDMLEMIVQRVKAIPVDQNTPMGAQFRIDVTNNTDETAHVTLADAKQISGGSADAGAKSRLPFEKNIVLVDLQPRRYFRCTMHIDELYASARTDGCRAVASGVRSILANPDDAYDPHTGVGTPIMQSNHTSWLLCFDTNGIMSAKDIIAAACARILRRLHDVHGAAQEKFEFVNGEHRLTIADSGTIGELIRQKVYYSQNEVDAVFLNLDDKSNTVTIRIKTQNNPMEIISGAVDLLIADFTAIKSSL